VDDPAGRGGSRAGGAVLTIPALKALAQRTLDYGIERIRETGELMMTFTLVKRDGGIEMIGVDGETTNSGRRKDALAKTLKARVSEGQIEAILMLSDVFFADDITPQAEAIRQQFGMTIEQAAAAGLCRRREAVYCILQSPILALWMKQEYRRDGSRVELVGAPEVQDDASGDWQVEAGGRFTGFFPPVSAGRA
jgi:hypothetical protein